jgi:hypothetical protein
MAESSDWPKSERQRIIEWYESDIERYKGMIGKKTEFNTIVTQKLIDSTQARVDRLKEKERKWNDIRRRQPQQG